MRKRGLEERRESILNLVKGKFEVDVTKFEYSSDKIELKCIKCGHIVFRNLGNIKRSANNCPKCVRVSPRKKTQKQFEKEMLDVWGDSLDLTKSIYTGVDDNILLKCKKHNIEYSQITYEALRGAKGCPECKKEHYLSINLKPLKVYRERLLSKYPNKEITLVNRQGKKGKLKFKCKKHNATFISCIYNVMRESFRGCSVCIEEAKTNSPNTFIAFYDKPTWLYYVKLTYNHKNYYKIGITTKDDIIKGRFGGKRYSKFKPTLLLAIHYEKGRDAYEEESKYIKMFKEFKISYNEKFLPSGNTEVFNKDVFNLDRK